MVTANANLLWLIAGTFGALVVGTGVRLVALRNATAEIAQKRFASLKVWWVLALLWSAAALFGPWGTSLLLAIASVLAMREFLRLIGPHNVIGNAAIVAMAGCGATHYLLIVAGAGETAKWFLPTTSIVLLGAIRATTGNTEGYIRITAGLFWGMMLLVYSLSHCLFLFDVDSFPVDSVKPTVGPVGWFLFLVLLTEMNDIMQAIVGRKWGRTKVAPVVSPNKSLEGLAGGIVCTIVLSLALAPVMTTLMVGKSLLVGLLIAALAGLLISLAGFLGDINMSAVKRDVGVKDGSDLLPGMGGVIDRIDSLTFTAPVFYYFVLLAKYIF